MWQAQQSAKALSLFAALVAPPVDGQPMFDPDNAATYIGLLAAAMAGSASRGRLVTAAEELPDALKKKGLGVVYNDDLAGKRNVRNPSKKNG